MKNKEKKTTSEKPVTLSPLNFKEALKGLLGVKPKKEEKEENNDKKDGDNHPFCLVVPVWESCYNLSVWGCASGREQNS